MSAWLEIKLLIKLWQEIREYFGWRVLFENVNKTIGETNKKAENEKKSKCNVIQNFVRQVERKAALNGGDSLLLKSSCLPSQACIVTMYRYCCFWRFYFVFKRITESRKKTKIWIFSLAHSFARSHWHKRHISHGYVFCAHGTPHSWIKIEFFGSFFLFLTCIK